MSYFAKQKLNYYKRYKIDIWGFFHNTLQVVYDNTLYSIYILKREVKRIQKEFKKTAWEYFKYKRIFEKNKLEKIETLEFDIDVVFDQHLKSRQYYVMKKICLNYLLNNFIKNYTTSYRLSKIFRIFNEYKKVRPKRFIKKPFIYELRSAAGPKRRRRVKSEIITFRIARLFYVIYTYKQLKKIGKKAKSQDGLFEQNYLQIVESKLPSYLYRTALFATIFDGLDFVKNSNVWINKKYKPFVHYTVKLFDIVGFRPVYKSFIWWLFFKRIRRKAFLFLFSRCIYLSLSFLFTVLIAKFTKKDMVNTFDFDYYRLINHTQ